MGTGADDLELVAPALQQRHRVDEVLQSVPLHQAPHRQAPHRAVRDPAECHPGTEAVEVHAALHHRVAEPRIGAPREPAQALRRHDDPVRAVPDPARERMQQPVRPLHAAVASVEAGDVRAAQRDDHRCAVEVEQRQHRRGRQREDEVDDVVLLPVEQAAHGRRRRRQVAHGPTDPRLVRRAAVARHAMHGEESLLLRAAVPAELGVGRGPLAAGDDVHHHPARGQPLRQRRGSQARAAAERRVLVVEQQHAHEVRSLRSSEWRGVGSG